MLFGKSPVNTQIQLQVPEIRIQTIGALGYITIAYEVKHVPEGLFYHYGRTPELPVLIPPSACGGIPHFFFNQCFMPLVPIFKAGDPHVLLHHTQCDATGLSGSAIPGPL